jgi:hypothetical protein
MTMSRCAWVGTNGFGPRPLTILLIPPSLRSFRAIEHQIILVKLNFAPGLPGIPAFFFLGRAATLVGQEP